MATTMAGPGEATSDNSAATNIFAAQHSRMTSRCYSTAFAKLRSRPR